MYYDLFINYENSNNVRDKYNDFCELLTSALCDSYSVLATTTVRKGTVFANDTNNYKEIDLKLIFQTYSLKFLNSARINPVLIDWNAVRVISRLNVELNDTKDLFQFSNPNAALKSYDLLSVLPKNEKVFDACLSDLNVDIISLNLEEKFNFSIKKHLILSAIDKNAFFEIVYSGFIKDATKRSMFIANVLMLLEVTPETKIEGVTTITLQGKQYYQVCPFCEGIFES